MNYSDFLNTTKVLRMLYGLEVSTAFFEKNIGSFYNLNAEDLAKTIDNATVSHNT